MDYIYWFFGLQYADTTELLLRVLLLIAVSAVIIWLIYLLVAKLIPPKPQRRIHRDHFLRLSFLSSLTIFLLIFNVYIFFLIKLNGLHSFYWLQPRFYLNILPQLIILLGLILLYFANYSFFTKSLKSKGK